MNDKAKQALTKVLDLFESGDVPEALSIILLPRLNVPSACWSPCNRLLMLINETQDARGFRQWQLVGRNVKKGSKAITIICPKTALKENDNGQKEPVVIGFRAAPVFRYEDTEGSEIKVESFPPPELPPLYDVAQKWNIDVSWKGYPGSSYGRFSHSKNIIELCTHDEEVFWHELAHAAHAKMLGGLSSVQTWRKEIVAELTASVIAHIYSKRCNTGEHYRYIKSYAQKSDLDVFQACMAVVTDVSRCLDLILKEEQKIPIAA